MFRKNSVFLRKETLHKIQIFRYATTGEQQPKTISDYASDDFQYLQKSSLPTMHFQKGLLKLPIPKLEKTCELYLNALKPLLDNSQFEKTKKLVDDFKNKEGKELDEKLRKKASTMGHTSYISKPWFEMYLKDRQPLPLNYNPGIILKESRHSDSESQICKATNVTVSSLRFMKSLRKNILIPDIFHLQPKYSETEFYNSFMKFLPSKLAVLCSMAYKAFPLDMSQYSSLFNNTRIPREGQDYLEHEETGRHIIVIRRGHFFRLNVLDEKGDILPPEDIFTGFKYILSQDLKPNTESVGYLTTENRDVWARAREHLISINPDNYQNVKGIDSAAFVICLDDDDILSDPLKTMRTYLHGDGMNRWFDKSFSLIISKDGRAGVNFEHSWGDGIAIIRYLKELYGDLDKNPFTNSSTQARSNVPLEKLVQKLDFTLDEQSSKDVKIAKQKFEDVCKSLGLDIVLHNGLGKATIPSGVASDLVMQLSFQIAFHRVYSKFVGTYESCSTATFKHGRTETIRPLTEPVKNFALQFNSKSRPGKTELMNLLLDCSKMHNERVKDAHMGKGFDRHLFGLKHTSEELGLPLPDLFKDEAYKILNYNIISTSTLPYTDILSAGGFGPVVPDGLGVGYTIQKEACGCIVSSYPGKRPGKDFVDALTQIYQELQELFRGQKK